MMNELQQIEKTIDSIVKHIVRIRATAAPKFIIHEDGTFEDVTEYPDCSHWIDMLGYWKTKLAILRFEQTQGHKRIS